MNREELLEAMAREHDREDAAQKGEPSPWRGYEDDPDPEWRAERIAAMSAALSALTPLLKTAVDALESIRSDAELHMMGLTSSVTSIQRAASSAHAKMKELIGHE